MQIVIDMDTVDYEYIKNGCIIPIEIDNHIYDAIRKGTPLPKEHGRLVDADDIRVIELEDSLHFMQHKKGDDVDVYIDAPTIIEADTGSEE